MFEWQKVLYYQLKNLQQKFYFQLLYIHLNLN